MTTENSPESEASNSADDLKYTELTLRLPGELSCPELRHSIAGSKRGSSPSYSLDLNLGQRTAKGSVDDKAEKGSKWIAEEEEEASSVPKPPPAKAQIVGWPPLRPSRKNIATTTVAAKAKYVKVAVDGAPFLRKVDLQVYTCYEQLLKALGDMFSRFTIRNYINDGKLMEPVDGSEYVAAYEDKDGDWMMVGDVPWKMFVESCKRLRLMKSSDAIGLAPTTP